MGNIQISSGTSRSLSHRIKYSDRSLSELNLTDALEDEELDAIVRALPGNNTIVNAVLFDAFSRRALESMRWNDFVNGMVSLQSLQQVELLETQVPITTMRHLLENPSLQALAVTDGIELGSITSEAINELAAAIHPRLGLEEFCWECQFPNFQDFLDPLLLALAFVPDLKLLGFVQSGVVGPSQAPLLSPKYLFEFCQQQKAKLVTLEISGCGLVDNHLEATSKGFASVTHLDGSPSKDCPALKVLQIHRNQATTSGMQQLLRLLQQSCELHHLRSDVSGHLQEKLQCWSRWNHHVRRFLGRSPALQTISRILPRIIDDPDFLYLMLQEFPEIYLRLYLDQGAKKSCDAD